MYQAIREVLGRVCRHASLMGTDVPEVRSEYLERAFGPLSTKRWYWGLPGMGYYLVGMEETAAGRV